jgi:predicted Zn-dependent protease
MRLACTLVAGLALILAGPVPGQVSPPSPPPQIQHRFELGRRANEECERSGRISDPAVVNYIQGLEARMAAAAGGKAFDVRITRASEHYACLRPHGVLYISGGMLERCESAAELAGLLAHQHAHARSTAASQACVLASPPALSARGGGGRQAELLATTAAIQTLKLAGYDPSAVLDLFSRLAYAHPAWQAAIATEDLLSLRTSLETDVIPEHGYLTDTSEFRKAHTIVAMALVRTPAPTLGPRR